MQLRHKLLCQCTYANQQISLELFSCVHLNMTEWATIRIWKSMFNLYCLRWFLHAETHDGCVCLSLSRWCTLRCWGVSVLVPLSWMFGLSTNSQVSTGPSTILVTFSSVLFDACYQYEVFPTVHHNRSVTSDIVHYDITAPHVNMSIFTESSERFGQNMQTCLLFQFSPCMSSGGFFFPPPQYFKHGIC